MCRILTSCVGLLFDLLALLACLAAFALPYWVYCPDGCNRAITQTLSSKLRPLVDTGQETFMFEGLLARVNHRQEWKYFWHDDFLMEQQLPDWYKASQALFTFGFVILLSTVFLSLMHVACRCCCQKAFSLATVIGSLIFSAFVLIGASLVVFVLFQATEEHTTFTTDNQQRHFFFAVYVVAGGLLAALLASILFLADGCQRNYGDYQSARMV